MPTYFVSGATGNQGGAVASLLLSKGHTVRTITRNLSSTTSQTLVSQGAEVHEGSYTDPIILARILPGTTGLFLNPLLDPTISQADWTRTILKAATEAQSVRHIVVSTAFLTDRFDDHESLWKTQGQEGTWPLRDYYEAKREVEKVVKEEFCAGGRFTYTILRPSWLMYNYLLPQSGTHFPELYTPASELAVVYEPGVRMPHFDQADEAKFALAAFEDPATFGGQEIELGFENLTPEEAAAILTEVGGKEVRVRRRTPEEAKKSAKVVLTQGFHDLANWAGVEVEGGKLQKWGIELTTLKQFLQRERVKVKKAMEDPSHNRG